MPLNCGVGEDSFIYLFIFYFYLCFVFLAALKLSLVAKSGVTVKTLESPLNPRRSNQSILKEISPGYSLEGLMLKLKLQYFGHLMERVASLEKTLVLGGIGGRRRRR